jgi:hypothetical protein
MRIGETSHLIDGGVPYRTEFDQNVSAEARYGFAKQNAGAGEAPASSLEMFLSNRQAAAYWWSMIFSENRHPLFGIVL